MMPTGRLDAFGDGAFSIVMMSLALNHFGRDGGVPRRSMTERSC
jgi:hypothetical protein